MAKRIPLPIRTLYEDLMDRKMQQELFLSEMEGAHPTGTFVSKTVGGRLYWYFQSYENSRKRQRYIGPDGERVRKMISRLKDYKETLRDSPTEDLVSVLRRTPGLPQIFPEEGTIIASLEKAGVFRNGGVLVGTQAFRCYPLVVGVSLLGTAMRTGDIDLAYDRSLQVFVPEATETIVSRILDTLSFLPLPTLDEKGRSYSFKVKGSELTLEILTTLDGSERNPDRLKSIDAIGFYAQPLEYMDYLIAEPIKSVLLFGKGVLVNVPSPERFAVHKILVSQIRAVPSGAKAEKDLHQAMTLIESLADRHPDDLARAIRQMGERLKEDPPAREKFLAGVEALRRSIAAPLVSVFREEFLKSSGS